MEMSYLMRRGGVPVIIFGSNLPILLLQFYGSYFPKIKLNAYLTKTRNPGNKVKAKNSVFDVLMTSNDL